MTTTGDVQLTIADGASGAVVVPASSVQVVFGTSSSGTPNTVLPTRNLNTLTSTYGYGPLCEAAGLAIKAGGTVLAIKVAKNTSGTATAVTATAGNVGTCVVTTTLDATNGAFDVFYVKLLIVAGGTIGTAGITFQLSLDAGRTFGPVIALGTATTFVIPQTGITLNFAAGTVTANNTYTFATTAPAWSTATLQAAVTALQNSPYALTGWGSVHVVGDCTGAVAQTIQGMLDTLVTGYVFTRVILSARDALLAATPWGGTGAETDATWSASIGTDYTGGLTTGKRICPNGGFYNVPSVYANPVAGAPRYRRPLAWVLAARSVTIPPQRHAGRVKDGALSQIVVDPVNDPLDGFVYHDERTAPSLDGLRFSSARTRVGLPGYYIVNPNLFSPFGSDFTLLPLGNVMDIGCTIVHQVGQQIINSDIRLNANGTIYENEAKSIESALKAAIDANMTSQQMLSQAGPGNSGCVIAVDRTTNVKVTNVVTVTVSLYARGYVLQENITIGFASPNLN